MEHQPHSKRWILYDKGTQIFTTWQKYGSRQHADYGIPRITYAKHAF